MTEDTNQKNPGGITAMSLGRIVTPSNVDEYYQTESNQQLPRPIIPSTSSNSIASNFTTNPEIAESSSGEDDEDEEVSPNLSPQPTNKSNPQQPLNDSSEVTPVMAAAAIATFKTISAMNTVRRRRRTPLSCQVCRSRKQKCDRGRPCSTCKTLHLEKSCVYQTTDKTGTSSMPQNNGSISLIGSNGAIKKSEMIKIFNPNTRRFYRINGHADDSASYGPVSEMDRTISSSSSSILSTIPGRAILTSPSPTFSSILEKNSKPTIRFKFNRINFIGLSSPISISGGLDDTAPEAYTIFNFHAAENKKSLDDLKKFIIPKSHLLLEKEQQIKLLADNLSTSTAQWDKVLDYIPPRDICDFLIERFLSSVNTIYYCTTASTLREDMNYVWIMKRHRPTGDKLEKIEIHKICLILVCLRLARISLGNGWNCSSVTNNIDDDLNVYLGPNLVLFSLSALAQTDVQLEGNLSYIQLLYLCTSNLNLTMSDVSNTSISTLTLTSRLIESALSIGLHRDPENNYPEVPVRYHQLWRILWRQIVIADTTKSLELGLPPLINLKYTDTKLYDDNDNELSIDGNLQSDDEETSLPDYEYLGKIFLKNSLEYSLTCRTLLDEVLLNPLIQRQPYNVYQMKELLNQLELARKSAYEEAITNVNMKSSLLIQHEHCYVTRTISYLKHLRMKLAFLRIQTSSEEVTNEMIETSLKSIAVQNDLINNVSKFTSFNYYLLVETFRVNRSSWMKLMMTVTNSIVKSSAQPDQIVYILDTIISMYKQTMGLVNTSYSAWRENISMLMALRNIQSLSQVVGHSNLDQLWQKLEPINELPVPRISEWLGYFTLECSSTEKGTS